MTTEERLRAALDAKAATAAPSPHAYAEVRVRVARRRVVSRLQIAGAALATAAVAAGTVAVVQQDEAAPVPVTTQPPSPEPSPAASEEPSLEPTPSAAPGTLPQGVPADEFVAALEDGRIVSASASDGRIGTILTRVPDGFVAADGDLALSPDRRTVYFAVDPLGDPPHQGQPCVENLRRLDVTTGAVSTLTSGRNPQVSPDGRRLAFDRECGGGEWLVVRDLANGAETEYVNDYDQGDPPGAVPLILADLAWHADGARIWLTQSWESAPELRLLDLAADRSLRDATDVPTEHGPFWIERRGADLAFVHDCCYPHGAEDRREDRLVVLRDAAGREREVVRVPASERLDGLQVGPGGELLYVRGDRLYRHDPETGETTDLGSSTAIARDW